MLRLLRHLRFRRPFYFKSRRLPDWVDEEVWGVQVAQFGMRSTHLLARASHRYDIGAIMGNERTGEFVRVIGYCNLGCLIVERAYAGTKKGKWKAKDRVYVAGSVA